MTCHKLFKKRTSPSAFNSKAHYIFRSQLFVVEIRVVEHVVPATI